LVVFAELFASILLLAGLASRMALIPLIINMLVAFFIVHAADPFANKELAFLYLIVYIALMITGPGKFSIDYYMSKKKNLFINNKK
jgi:putative oxidoreductase